MLKTAGELIRGALFQVLQGITVPGISRKISVVYVVPQTMTGKTYPVVEVCLARKVDVKNMGSEQCQEKWEISIFILDTVSKSSSTKRDDDDGAVLRIRDAVLSCIRGDEAHLGLERLHLYNRCSGFTLHDPEMIRESTRVCGLTMSFNVVMPKCGYIEIADV